MADDLLPTPTEVQIRDFLHIKLCFEYVGAVMVLETIEKLQEEFPKVAGIGLAVATAKVGVADQRTRMMTKNIKLAMKHGMDIDNCNLTMEVKKDGVYLSTSEPQE